MRAIKRQVYIAMFITT